MAVCPHDVLMSPLARCLCRDLRLVAVTTPARFTVFSSAASTSHLHRRACEACHARHRGYAVARKAMAADEGSAPSQAHAEDPIVQYIVMRRDLYAEEKWPLGSVIAQGCHASAAALWLSKDSKTTKEYCAGGNLDNMHKVVLEVKGETQLRNLAQKLQEAGVEHKLWIEQPEGISTCLATVPSEKSTMQLHFKKLKLCNL